jgi:hypothetical protein
MKALEKEWIVTSSLKDNGMWKNEVQQSLTNCSCAKQCILSV